MKRPMQKNKFIPAFWTCFLVCLLFTTCKKEIKEVDFAGSNGNLYKIFNIDSIGGVTPVAQFNRPGGGYVLIYQPTQSHFGYATGLVAVAIDKDGNIIHSSTLGGSGLTYTYGVQMDDFGNVYMCGLTNSKDLRKDIWVDSVGVDKYCAYLAKVDKDANVLWQIAHNDGAAPKKDSLNEEFWGMEIVNNKPICIGANSNYNTSRRPRPWLVSFDENGKFVKQRFMPPLYGIDPYYGLIYSNWYNLIKLPGNELIVRAVFNSLNVVVGSKADTGSYLLRYNPGTDNIVWQKFYRKNSKEYDLTYCRLLGNGNLAFFDFLFNTLNIIDASSGNTLSSVTIHNNTINSNIYYNAIPYMQSTIDGDSYFMGQVAYGSFDNGRKPFLIKLNSNGGIVYEKIFNIPEAGFYWVSKNEKGNLQVLGGIKYFENESQKMFTVCVNKDGNPVSK